jgi:hypothetical protein
MEKMIIGIVLCIIGGAGFLSSLGGIGTVVETINGMPKMETVTAPVLILNAIIFIVSILIFGIGILLIQQDRGVDDEYRRY